MRFQKVQIGQGFFLAVLFTVSPQVIADLTVTLRSEIDFLTYNQGCQRILNKNENPPYVTNFRPKISERVHFWVLINSRYEFDQ